MVGCALLLATACAPSRSSEEGSGATSLTRSSTGDGLVISQVYGGAGSTGALFNRDFVELFNRSSAPIALRGLSLHLGTDAGDFVVAARLPESAVVPPGGYYLVGFAAGAGDDLRPDAAGQAFDIRPVNGKVAIARDVASADPASPVAPLVCSGPRAANGSGKRCASDRLVDLVGFGVSADREGGGAAPPAAVKLALQRKAGGCADTDDNASDFEAVPPAPRTSATAANVCKVIR